MGFILIQKNVPLLWLTVFVSDWICFTYLDIKISQTLFNIFIQCMINQWHFSFLFYSAVLKLEKCKICNCSNDIYMHNNHWSLSVYMYDTVDWYIYICILYIINCMYLVSTTSHGKLISRKMWYFTYSLVYSV